MGQNFQEMTRDIISHPLFLQLKDCPHHGGENSLYIHSIDTAKCAYRLARRFYLREERVRALTRAALLHDFFGYDWQSERHQRYMSRYSGWQRVRHMHAFIHGAHAARRAGRLFDLDQRQRDQPYVPPGLLAQELGGVAADAGGQDGGVPGGRGNRGLARQGLVPQDRPRTAERTRR